MIIYLTTSQQRQEASQQVEAEKKECVISSTCDVWPLIQTCDIALEMAYVKGHDFNYDALSLSPSHSITLKIYASFDACF